MEENFSMEWNMEENFNMEWNMEWKMFGMEWKRNGRKLPVWNMAKSSSIPFHTMPWARPCLVYLKTSKAQTKQLNNQPVIF